MEQGKIYSTTSNLGNYYIFRAGEGNSKVSNIIPENREFENDWSGMSGDIMKGIKEATYEEAFWLEECERQKKFIPKKEINFQIQYSIY